MSAAINRPFPVLRGAPQAPWLRFLEGDGTETPGSTPGTPATPAPKPDDPPAQETDWKALYEQTRAESRKWEGRAKENSKAAEKLQEIEDAKKSEIEKANERAEKAERRLQELEAKENLRELADEVARVKRVPAYLLRGATKEELEAHADQILAFKPEKPGVVPNSGTNGGDKDKVTSSVAAGRERFEARRNKNKSS